MGDRMTSALLRRARITRNDNMMSTMIWLPPGLHGEAGVPVQPGSVVTFADHTWRVVAISNPITVDLAQAHPGWCVPPEGVIQP